MNKKIFSILATTLLLATNTAFADKLPTFAYGKWLTSDGETLTISTKGISEVNHTARQTKGCKPEYEYRIMSGKKLIDEIMDSVQSDIENYSDDPNDKIEHDEYVKQIQTMISLINRNQQYTQITATMSCGDGAQSFIALNQHTGISILSAPEDYYSLVFKK